MATDEDNPISFMRIKQVAVVTGLSKTSVYDLIRAGEFPRPVKISTHRSGWVKAEVDEWGRKRVEERDAAKPKRIQRQVTK